MLADLADIALARGDLDEAVGFAERSWEIREAKGLSSARALGTLGEIAMRTGDLDRAEQLLDEAAAQYRDSGHEENLISTIGSLAGVARRRRELSRAEELLREGLRRVVALDDRSIAAGLLREFAVVADERGFDERAGILWGAADAVFEAEGIRRGLDFNEEVPTVSDEALEAGAKLSYEEAVEYALTSID